MKWVSREHVHVDRTACPRLIKNFDNPKAEFIFVPAEKIGEVVISSEKAGEKPYCSWVIGEC
jgi:hypothetical protein